MYIYSRSVNVGLRRRSARIENVKSADIRNCIQTVDMTSLQQATDRFYANEEKGFHGYQPSALLFVEGIGEKSQDCMLETCCFRYLFPVHPKPAPIDQSVLEIGSLFFCSCSTEGC